MPMKIAAIAIALAACALWATAHGADTSVGPTVTREWHDILKSGESRPAPASPLLTDPKLKFDLVSAAWRGKDLTVLVQRRSASTDSLLGFVSRARKSDDPHAAYHWHPVAARRCQASAVDLAALEHMFRVAINDVVTERYRFAIGDGRQDESDSHLTHAQLLLRIAEERECVAGALTNIESRPLKRWRSVLLEPADTGGHGAVVSARLRSADGPVLSATILFTRAPHLECSASTDSKGVASCRLEDMHGHDDHGDESPGAPTLASCPGEVKSDLIMLPTTLVLPRRLR
jgi:hypothetical protein